MLIFFFAVQQTLSSAVLFILIDVLNLMKIRASFSVRRSGDRLAFLPFFLFLYFFFCQIVDHFHKHIHQSQNPIISVMFCHELYSRAVSLSVIIAEKEAEVCD